MSDASEIAAIAAAYDELKRTLQSTSNADRDAPEALLERQTVLVCRLISEPALNGPELASKARVLLDWVMADDLSAKLTVSLCRDAICVFPHDADQRGPPR